MTFTINCPNEDVKPNHETPIKTIAMSNNKVNPR